MGTMWEEKTAKMTDFHKTIFKLIFIVGITCVVALAAFDFFSAGGSVVVLTFIVEVGNIKIWKWRVKRAQENAFSEYVESLRTTES